MSETWRISVVECSENIIIFCPGLQPEVDTEVDPIRCSVPATSEHSSSKRLAPAWDRGRGGLTDHARRGVEVPSMSEMTGAVCSTGSQA